MTFFGGEQKTNKQKRETHRFTDENDILTSFGVEKWARGEFLHIEMSFFRPKMAFFKVKK
jgi:hypothetical protein